MNVYADSSFVVSTCVRDSHTIQAALRMSSHPSVWITPLNRAEVANALHRYAYRGAISAGEAKAAWEQFEKDRITRIWIEVELPDGLWETDIGLSHRFGPTLGVRTLDSLHVACALELRADKFWTFDERQAKLAQAVGLDTKP